MVGSGSEPRTSVRDMSLLTFDQVNAILFTLNRGQNASTQSTVPKLEAISEFVTLQGSIVKKSSNFILCFDDKFACPA